MREQMPGFVEFVTNLAQFGVGVAIVLAATSAFFAGRAWRLLRNLYLAVGAPTEDGRTLWLRRRGPVNEDDPRLIRDFRVGRELRLSGPDAGIFQRTLGRDAWFHYERDLIAARSAFGDEALLDFVVDFGFKDGAPTREVARVLLALDRLFRICCDEKDLPFDGLDFVASGAGSFFGIGRPRFKRTHAGEAPNYERMGYRATIAGIIIGLAPWAIDKATEPNFSSEQIEASREMRDAARDLRDAIREARAAGASDVTISAAGARCTIPAPERGGDLPNRPLLTTIEFDAERVGGTIAARTNFCPRLLPIEDHRFLGDPLAAGRRYQATARLVADQDGTVFVIQLRDVNRIDG